MELNKIYTGDCLEVLKGVESDSVDLVFTSPPYNMRTRIRNGKYTTREKSEHFSKKYDHFGDDMPIDKFYLFHKQVLAELSRVSRIAVYNIGIVTGSKEAFFKIIGDFSESIKDIIVWDKGYGQPAMHGKVLNSCYELLLIFENGAGRAIQNSYFNRGELDNIFRIGRPKENYSSHSAIFPLELANKVIINFSKEGDLVLDPFLGSGTTAVACKELNRNYIGIELNPEYVKIAEKRLRNTTPPLLTRQSLDGKEGV